MFKSGRVSKSFVAIMVLGVLVLTAVQIFKPVSVGALQSTVIDVNPYSELGAIKPEVYGVNHRYHKYGYGSWDTSTQSMYASFTSAYADAGFKSMRYPGGTVSNLFRWKDAIGPVSQRKRCIHGGTYEPNATDFGLDEVAKYCESQHTSLVYVYSAGSGSAQDAADLVEYLNAPNNGSNPGGGTDWAAVRANNGHPAPYNIKSFEIGNEMYLSGQRYWLGGTSGNSYQNNYVFGGTVTFTGQNVGLYDDWRDTATTSNGTANQVKYAKYAPVNSGTDTVSVNGTAWTRVSSLSARGAENVYTIDNTTGQITFGDGVHGNIPPNGQAITVSYTTVHDGFNSYYSAMKAIDPNIKIYSCLDDSTFINLMGSTYPYDGLIDHPYSGGMPNGLTIDNYHDYAMLEPDKKRNSVEDTQNSMRSTVGGTRAASMSLVCSEYGILSNNAPVNHYLQSLDHGLYVAQSIMNWIELGMPQAQKHCLIDFINGDTLGPGEQAAIINDAPNSSNFIVAPTNKVFKMFSNMFGPTRVSSSISNNPTRTVYNSEILKKLKVSASKDGSGNVYLMIVNCDRADNVAATVQLANYSANGSAAVWTLNGPGYASYNTVSAPNTVDITTGSITGAASFDYTFPAHSVTAIKLSGSVLTPTPAPLPPAAGYWKYDETSGTAANDSSGNGKTGTVNGAATWTTAGKLNGALNFDGVDDYVSLPNLVDPSATNFTVAAWVKLSAIAGTNTQVILQQDGTNGKSWLYRKSGGGNLATYLGGTELQTTGTIATGSWYHVAVVNNNGTVKLYLNGQPDGYATRTIAAETSGMLVGRHKIPDTVNEKWNGQIDEVYIYNSALSDNQILSLYTGTGPTATPGATSTPTPTPTPTSTPTPASTATPTPAGTATPTPTPDASLKGYWKFNETSGTSASDSSGNNKTGTLIGGSSWTTGGKINGAVNLDGTTGYASLPYIINPSANFTAAAWVKLDSSYGTNSQVILQQEGTNGKTWLLRKSSTGKLSSYLGGADTLSNGTIAVGSWYHVAIVNNGGTVKLYINGLPDGSASRPIASETSGAMRVGCHKTPDTTNEEWDGTVDEVRIYNRALSDTEILNLYNGN
jgi:alpha-L-arabinofuranosidase